MRGAQQQEQQQQEGTSHSSRSIAPDTVSPSSSHVLLFFPPTMYCLQGWFNRHLWFQSSAVVLFFISMWIIVR
jgi:hypothetical protein